MSRVRSSKTVKSIRGGGVIVKTAGKSIRQLQCPRCHQNASPTQDEQGKIIYRCGRGHVFGGSRKM